MEKDLIIEDDLTIANGDLFIGECTNQNIKYLLISTPGNFYAHPKTGVQIFKWQNSSITDYRKFESTIKDALKSDGYGNIKITGVYEGSASNIKVTADRIGIPTI